MYKYFPLIAACLSLAFVSAPSLAERDLAKVGILSCEIEGGIGLIIGSAKDMTCVFIPRGGKGTQRYNGRITRLGIDVGVTNKSYMQWAVFAPSKLAKGALEGDYGGLSAQATVFASGSNWALAGGLNKSVSLRPLSDEEDTQTGLNLAAGIAGLNLVYAK